jgi:hypothetical protein
MTQPSRPSRPTRTPHDLPEHRDGRLSARRPNRRASSRNVAARGARHVGIPAARDSRDGRDGRFAGSTELAPPDPQPRRATRERARL